MKKIFIIVVLSLLSLTAFSQNPFKIYNPDIRFKWGSDSIRFSINGKTIYVNDTLYFTDGSKMWSADSAGMATNTYWKKTGDELEPNVSTNYINTDSSYYLKGVDLIRYDVTLNNLSFGEGAFVNNTTGDNNISSGYQSLMINTTGFGNTSYGNYSLINNTNGNYNTASGIGTIYNNITGNYNTANGAYALYGNITDSNNIALGYRAGYYAAMSNRLWIGAGDSNNAIIYGEMLTRPRIRINGELNVSDGITANGTIINGGLINRDTVLVLADDSTFQFPKTSVGWAEIQCDSLLVEKTWGIVSWNGDGSTSLRSNGAKFVNTDTDGNYACFYDGGAYAILRNTSGSTQTYSIKYHYHY